MTTETVYIVFHRDDTDNIWVVGNVFKDSAKAKKEAEYYHGYVLTRYIIK